MGAQSRGSRRAVVAAPLAARMRQGDVLDDPERLEPGPFSAPRDVAERAGLGIPARVDRGYAEVHAGSGYMDFASFTIASWSNLFAAPMNSLVKYFVGSTCGTPENSVYAFQASASMNPS